jgi:class 3 adenylate cyclase
VVKELSAHTNEIMLEGKSRRVTVMFCDLRNFTPLTIRYDGKLV